jgi:hypothetical protein
MKLGYRLVLILSLAFATNSYATITCGKPKLSKVGDHDPIYHFKATVKCDLTGETINLKTLKDSYLAEITNRKSQFKVRKQENYDDKKGMTGYLLDVTQSYNSENGAVVVHADVILADNKSTNFFMELRSKSVHGEDDAKYNTYILNDVSLVVGPQHSELTLSKEIDVEDPWYAPQGMFFDKVETELLDSIHKAAQQHAQKMRGDKVEALRK